MNDREDEPELDETDVEPDSVPDADEEALSWDGDDDVVRGDESEDGEEEQGPRRGVFDVVREMNGKERIVSAFFVLVSLAWAVGWGIVVAQNPIRLPDMLMTVMYELGEFLTIAASPLAVFTVIQFTRGRARLIWLVAMALVTFPWPLIVEGIA